MRCNRAQLPLILASEFTQASSNTAVTSPDRKEFMQAQHNHSIQLRYQGITQTIAQAARRRLHQHPNKGITLIAVSKTRPISDINQLIAYGHTHFGENYPQEAIAKIKQVRQTPSEHPIVWHFIGRLQSNKTQQIADHFDWIHTVDREKLISRLANQRPPQLLPLNLCIQINIDQSPQKAGVAPDLATILALGNAINQQERLIWRGLMCIPDPAPVAQTEKKFAHMYALFSDLKKAHPHLDTLSMGMSEDYEQAIHAGATHVRIGTQLFGARDT